MFGLMKSRSCSLTPEQKLNRRLHYCGTCKTMGRLYGQRTRFLLNNDAVFLAELLSAISGAGHALADWDRAYQSYNCLSLPATPEAMPLPLQYAAAGKGGASLPGKAQPYRTAGGRAAGQRAR